MVPVAGDVAATGFDMVTAFMEEPYKNYVSEQIEQEIKEFREGLDSGEGLHGTVMGGEDEARWHIQLQVAHVLLNEGIISLDDLEGTGAVVEGAGGDTYLRWCQLVEATPSS